MSRGQSSRRETMKGTPKRYAQSLIRYPLLIAVFPSQAQLLAELERQERELKEMQAMHDTISGAKPSTSTGEAPAASGSGAAAMDTAQDGEAGEGNAEQEEVDGRSVYVGNVGRFS